MEKLIGLPLYEIEGENLGNLYFDKDTTENAEARHEEDNYWATYDDDSTPIITRNGEELEHKDVVEYFKDISETNNEVFFDYDIDNCYERESDGEYIKTVQFFVFSYPSQIEMPIKYEPDEMGIYKESLCLDCYAFDNGELTDSTIYLNLCASYNHNKKKYFNIRLTEAILHCGLNKYKLKAKLSQEGEFEVVDVSL